MDKIEGRNPVLEALSSGREIDKIFIKKGDFSGTLKKIAAMARARRIVLVETEKGKLDAMSETKAHQGVIAVAPVREYASVEDILAVAQKKQKPNLIVITDGINDPHNLGAIIRTANAAGADGVIIAKRHSVGLSSVVAKASAGAVEFTPVAKVSNIAQTIQMLKKQNIWVIGADMNGQNTIYNHDFSGNVAIVIGSEGAGISRVVKEACDFLVKIPMYGEISSLNASVAGALMIYEAVRKREAL